MSKALVIIDVQANLFDAPKAHRIDEVATLLSGMADKARAAGVPVIFVQHEEDGCEWERGTPGWEFHPSLAPRAGDSVVAKRYCDSFRDTDLTAVLARLGADELIVGGYASDYCVDTTVRAAASRDIQTTVIADGHTASDRPHLDAASIVRHHGHVWSTFDANVTLRNSGDIVF
ncbi:cysteine hydrolase family protein [Oryzibacter oryziterrae]|uniref:cysteine hydrolase family protein n=1 Tax=Oryzibacter oryziterrae TaxID=2766474 RepID=UPI001F19E8BF|nr:cysteine hydrolase family protein [Oryzibacter oryziterrae]